MRRRTHKVLGERERILKVLVLPEGGGGGEKSRLNERGIESSDVISREARERDRAM